MTPKRMVKRRADPAPIPLIFSKVAANYYHLKSFSGIDLAISKALKQKKNFNEGKFVGWATKPMPMKKAA